MTEKPSHPLLTPWHRCVRATPASPAVIEAGSGRIWSFEEIDERRETLRQELGRHRLNGIPVAFREPNGGEWVARFLALLQVNAPALPLDSSTPPTGIRETAGRCGAAEWTSDGEILLPERPRRYRAPAIALLKLTSGTTGEARALAFRAIELAADGRQIMSGMGIGRGDRNFGIVPFGHSYGLGNLIMPLLLEGVPILCGSSPLPHVIAAEFNAGKASVLPAVPALFSGLVRAQAELRDLRLAITAGAPLKPELARAFLDRFGQPLHNFLGSSESGGIAYDAGGEAGLTGRGVGQLLPQVEVTFDRRNRLSVTSPAVFTRGNRLAANGCGRVILGDRGEMNPLGELVLQGRDRPMIKVGARRLAPAEIEHALLELEGVREAWVTNWHSGGEDRPAAVVAATPGAAELRAILRQRLPGWKIPRPLVVVTALPLTQRGKPDREALHQCLEQAETPREKRG